MNDTIDSLKRKLEQLKELHAGGSLPDDKYQEGKELLERQILDLVLSAPAQSKAAAPSAAAAPVTAAPTSAARPSGLLMGGLVVGVLAIAVAGYLWKGTPTAPVADASQAASADGKGPQHSTTAEQITAMTEKLAARLKDKPDDVEGWVMLARSYSVLGRHAEALKAYEKAIALRKDDATLLADYADSMAVANNSSLEGEPMKLVERALKLEPKNLKALYLAGTYSFNKQDYKAAVKTWETLAQVGPPGNVFVREVEPAIAEARKLAGMPPPAQPLDAPAQPAAASGATVSGTVTLSPALAKQAQPDDTVFVFARAVEGSRMPLAILRKQVKDLPISFTLNDSMAMSPSTALSSVPQVIVGARISKSGNAMPQPGDLSGQSSPVKVGASGLKIEIKDTVKP